MATGGENIPDHYFIPMTKMDIDSWLYYNALKICNATCDRDEISANICCAINLDFERYNLYFVNNLITYDQLTAEYRRLAAALKSLPRIPKFGEQLKNAGTFLVGAVAGFIAGGPIGMFTGGASAVGKIIADERNRRAAKVKTVLDKNIQQVQQTMEQKDTAKLTNYALYGVATLGVAGVIYWMLSD
jgi:hypothetical protein